MNYYTDIKNTLINNEITKRVKDYSKNKSDLESYYEVGRLLVEAQGGESRAKYGDGLIKEYSIRLTSELGKGYSRMSLKNMRKFYLQIKKGQTMSVQLVWSHYVELLSLDDINEINYYIKVVENNNLTVRELRTRIKSKEYKRLDDNTKNKMINNESLELIDTLKEPIVIINKNNLDVTKEKILQKVIMEDLYSFLNELGEGYTYVGNEYKIKIGNEYNYIDLLLFNYLYNSFVVIELKITELSKNHMGQIKTYMNYIDINVKKMNHNKTIGIILVHKNNKFIMEYCSDNKIISKEYIVI